MIDRVGTIERTDGDRDMVGDSVGSSVIEIEGWVLSSEQWL